MAKEITPLTAAIPRIAPEEDPKVRLVLKGSGVDIDAKLWRLGTVMELTRASAAASRPVRFDVPEQRERVRMAVLECAAAGYVPGRDASLVLFWNQRAQMHDCTVLPSYKAVLRNMKERGVLVYTPQIVHDQDDFEIERAVSAGGVETRLRHKPAKQDRGKPIGAYVCWSQGDSHFEVEYKDETHFQAVARTARSKGVWNGPFAPEMWRKTLIHWVAKFTRGGTSQLGQGMYDSIDTGPESAAPPPEAESRTLSEQLEQAVEKPEPAPLLGGVAAKPAPEEPQAELNRLGGVPEKSGDAPVQPASEQSASEDGDDDIPWG